MFVFKLVDINEKVLKKSIKDIIQVQPGEIIVTSSENVFKELSGETERLVKQLQNLLGKPKSHPGIKKRHMGIDFFHRRRHNAHVWVFMSEDLEKVKKIIGIKDLIKVPKDEVVISNHDTHFKSIVGDTRKLARALKQTLGNPVDIDGIEKEYKGVIFYHRKSSNNSDIWTFKLIDIDKVKELMKLKNLTKAKQNEAILSTTDTTCKNTDGITPKTISELKKKLGSPTDCSTEEKTYKGVVFYHRKSGSSDVWAFKKADIEKIKTALGIYRPQQLKSGEVLASSGDKVFKELQGRASELIKMLNEKIGNPEEVTSTKEYEGVTFFQRCAKNKRILWAFKLEDLEKVKKILGVRDILPLQPGEIAISNGDPTLKSVPGDTEEVVKTLSSMLGDPVKHKELELEKNGVTFTHRRIGSHRQWAFKQEDLAKVKKMAGLKDIKTVQPNDIVISTNEEALKVLAGDSHKMARQLNTMLGKPAKHPAATQEKHGVVFTHRKSWCHDVWVFDKKDINKVKAILGTEEKAVKKRRRLNPNKFKGKTPESNGTVVSRSNKATKLDIFSSWIDNQFQTDATNISRSKLSIRKTKKKQENTAQEITPDIVRYGLYANFRDLYRCVIGKTNYNNEQASKPFIDIEHSNEITFDNLLLAIDKLEKSSILSFSETTHVMELLNDIEENPLNKAKVQELVDYIKPIHKTYNTDRIRSFAESIWLNESRILPELRKAENTELFIIHEEIMNFLTRNYFQGLSFYRATSNQFFNTRGLPVTTSQEIKVILEMGRLIRRYRLKLQDFGFAKLEKDITQEAEEQIETRQAG